LDAETVSGPGPSLEFTYDQAGNTTGRTMGSVSQSLSWDGEGQLVQVDDGTDTSTMIYDADGTRLIRHDGQLVTVFLPGTEAVWDTLTDDVETTRYFAHAGQVVATSTGTDPADWTYHGVDHHGTTATHTVNAFSGVSHVRRMDPYGNPRGTPPQTWPGQQGFVGGVHDPTGLIHIGARPYDPATGRFIKVDPILDTTDDQQINGYNYANNNPIVYTDPTGLTPTCTPDGHNFCPDYDIRKQPVAPPPPCAGRFCVGPPRDPVHHGPWDDDFRYDPNATPALADYVNWNKWTNVYRNGCVASARLNVTDQVVGSVSGSQGSPAASWVRASSRLMPCLAAVAR
jgi:RHS repeat-associated protein